MGLRVTMGLRQNSTRVEKVIARKTMRRLSAAPRYKIRKLFSGGTVNGIALLACNQRYGNSTPLDTFEIKVLSTNRGLRLTVHCREVVTHGKRFLAAAKFALRFEIHLTAYTIRAKLAWLAYLATGATTLAMSIQVWNI